MINDDTHIINEWIVHHIININIDHIYIYDDRSKTSINKTISILPEDIKNKVTVITIEDDINFYNPNLQPQPQPRPQPQYVVIRYKNMPNKKDHTSCPICFDDYDDSSMVLSTECLHFFHEECLKKWADVNKTCPICRTNI